jgi:hypothetical protein
VIETCIIILGSIAIWQTLRRHRITRELQESTALLYAISNVADMDEDSRQLIQLQVSRNYNQL